MNLLVIKMTYLIKSILIITIICIHLNNINSFNVIGKNFNNMLKVRNENKELIPKIVKPTEKKSILTKSKSIVRNILFLPIFAIKTIKDVTYLTSDSIDDIMNPKSSITSSSTELISQSIKTIKDVTYLTSDSIDDIMNPKPSITSSSTEIISQSKVTIESVSEAIIELPQNVVKDVSISLNNTVITISNTVNTITNIPNNVIKTAKQLKKTVQKIIKIPGTILLNVKNGIDNIYDFTDKINGIETDSELKGKLVYSSVASDDKSIADEIKEVLFTTADTISGTISIVQDTVPKVINTIEEIPALPNKVKATYKKTEENFNGKVNEIKNGLDNTKESAIKFGTILYKVISLQAAKETIVSINTKYDKLIDTVNKTKETVSSVKEVIVSINKPEPFEKIKTTAGNMSATVNNIGETVKFTGNHHYHHYHLYHHYYHQVAIAGAFGSIGMTIFNGLGKVASIFIKRTQENDEDISNKNEERIFTKPHNIEKPLEEEGKVASIVINQTQENDEDISNKNEESIFIKPDNIEKPLE